MTNTTNTPLKPIDSIFARSDYAGEIVANVAELRARSYEALPGIFACCLSNPGDYFCDEFEAVLLARHAQEMFKANVGALHKVLTAQSLTKQDVAALTWLRSAAESFTATIERLRNEDQLWVPDEVERLLVPFDGEVPF